MKKGIKRIMSLLLIMTMCCMVFAGCEKVSDKKEDNAGQAVADTAKEEATPSSDTNVTENKTLEVAVFEGGYGREVWDILADNFEKTHEGVTVNITANPKIGDIIRPQIMSGNAPDVVFCAATNESGILQSLIQDKQLTCLDDLFDDELRAKIVPGTLDAPTVAPYGDGKIYSAPLFYSTMGLFYNKTLFAEKGYEVPTTWDEFLALGEKAKADGLGLFTYAAANDPAYNEIVLWPAIASAGGSALLDNCFNYKTGAWNSDPVKSVFGIYKTMQEKGYLLDGTLAMTHTQSQEQFLLSKCLFIPNGNWLELEMQDSPRSEGFEFGFTGIPVFSKNDVPRVWSNIEEIYVPAGAKNADLAKEFIKSLYDEESIILLAKNAGSLPPVVGAEELCKDVLSNSVYETYTITNKGFVTVTGGFANTEQTEINIRDDIFNSLNNIMAGEMTVDEWADLVEADSNKLAELVIE